jgi:photosystem II stability/assembly factor-like uncharacterized protein
VLALLREGLTNEQIAERLGVTYHAARFHVGEILSKLGVSTREEAAAWQPPEPRRAAGWTRALEGAAALAAAGTVAAVVLLALGVFSTSEGTLAPTQSAIISGSKTPVPTASFIPATPPAVGLNVLDMQLVSADFGWVLVAPPACPDFGTDCNQEGRPQDGGLMRVPFPFPPGGFFSGGAVARNILPAGVSVYGVRGVHFLDSAHGWLVTGEITTATEATQLVVYRTADGGATWQSANLGQPDFSYTIGSGAPIFIDFIDSERGWVVAPTKATVQESLGDLYRTEDGGVTWTKVTAVSAHPVYFENAAKGWAVGGGPGLGPTSRVLYATQDGGDSWQQVDLSPGEIGPGAPAEGNPSFDLPAKLDDGSLLLPVTVTGAEKHTLLRLRSTDGGQTWARQSSIDFGQDALVETQTFGDGSSVGVVSTGDRWFVFQPEDVSHEFTTPPFPGFEGTVISLSFIDQQRGWALVTQFGCRSFKADCWQVQYIEQTEDAGQSWSALSAPEVASPTP